MLKDLFHIAFFEEGTPDNSHALYHQVYVFTRGRGIVVIGQDTCTVQKNDVLVLSKGQTHRFGDNTLSGYLVQFNDAFWKQTPASANNCKAVLFDVGVVQHRITVAAPDVKSLTAIVDLALAEYASPDYSNKPDALAAFLKIIVIKIANIHTLLQEDIGSFDNKLYQDFVSLVNREAATCHDVASYAQKLGVSARKLSVTCYGHGRGAKEMINDRLMSEAKRSLQFTSKPVKEIALDLSFSTPYQFSHFFKKRAALSPEHYRKQFVKIGI
ncbi:AraC family transcriptional regulator [Dinghuibacter silviterrae]|uniref:AraC-like DNA-binding protein n=1 Tax=Dinghuibacter silviterrae TaxID=1539049 RepID=A0A4R8DVU3_9BACT|nr:helix-turn-helix transcriptional regulator [Dinghuibacter silviterrae]TDX01537.1 AraC-like DNA-binding protein [Dinghuibacter silviterrae]